MDDYVILIAPDGNESDELWVYDMGAKSVMSDAFELLVTQGKEDGNIYLCRVIKSAEVVNSGDLEVSDHGEEDERDNLWARKCNTGGPF